MCEGHEPSFLVRFGDFKRLRNRQKGIPEPPNILLVVDFSNYVSAEEFGDPDFDEDLMLNQIQLYLYMTKIVFSCPLLKT